MTEEEIDNYYNTISDNMDNYCYYKRIVDHGMFHSVLDAGNYYLEGFKTNSNYEWQKVTSYNLHGNRYVRNLERYKFEGNWENWVGIGRVISGFTATSITYNFGYYYPTLVIVGNNDMFKICVCSRSSTTEIFTSSDMISVSQNVHGDITITSINGINLGYTLIGWD